MDRLTGDFKGASMFATAADARIHSRLRQYEDTGLTPDEIAALCDENDRLCAALKLAQTRAADMETGFKHLVDANKTMEADIDAGRLVRTDTCTLSEDQDFDGSAWTCSKCNHIVGYSGEPPYENCPFCGRSIERYIGYDDPANLDFEGKAARAALEEVPHE